MSHPTKPSVHYTGFGWAKKGGGPNNPNSPQPNKNVANAPMSPNNTGQQAYNARGPNPIQPNNNKQFPPAANRNQQMNFQNQPRGNYAQSQRSFGPSPSQQNMKHNMNPQMHMQQQMGVAQSMSAAQMRHSMNPQQMQPQMQSQMQPQMQMRKSMPPQSSKIKTDKKKKKKKKNKDGKKSKDGKKNKTKTKNKGASLQQPHSKHMASRSAGNVPTMNQQTAVNQPHPQLKPVGSTGQQMSPQQQQQQQQMAQQRQQRVQIQQNPNVRPTNMTMQQMQQMNAANMKRQQMLRQQQLAAAQGNQYQRQVQRKNPQGAYGPNNPWQKYYQQRQMMMQQQQQRGRGANAGGNQQYQQQWQQYYQRMMQNPQGQLQRMVMQQQQMIANLKRQLDERDKHFHKTIQTTINFKDMEINELRKQITKLDEENEAIGELQLQNFQMKKELNNLRGGHQASVFDNLLTNINAAKGANKSAQAQWPAGVPPPPDVAPSNSTTEPAIDPRAALQAMLAAKQEGSEMLLTRNKKKQTAEERAAEDKNTGKYAKYARMKKIGMPMVSIVNKMRMDGMSAEEIEEYTGEKIGGGAKEEESGSNSAKVNLADPKFAKYLRMKKLNMPLKSIVNKMRLDGCSAAEMDAMEGKKAAKPDRKKQKLEEMRQLAETMGLNPCSESLPSKVAKMKRIHWDLVEISALRKTFWWELNQNASIPEHIDLGGKFELDFQVRQRKPRLNHGKQSSRIQGGLDAIANNKNKKGNSKKDAICWIAAKRDQSIQIALKRIGFPNEVIYDAIVDIDESVLTLDILEVVWDIVPSVDEASFAESKAEELADEELAYVGISEMFHIEMCTIPEVKEQVSKWLFARSFREIYMDRLAQVDIMQKCANQIKHSVAFQTYLRCILSMGNLMNHGTLKGMAYGFKMESVVKLLAGIKDYGGNKDLAMFLYQFAYNEFAETRSIFKEFESLLKKAVRLEITTIESSIVKMADEFVAIDLFLRRLQDDFHPGDTERFRHYMVEFQEKQESDMMNLKVKIQNAAAICEQTAKFYSIDLEDGKPESLFILVKKFLDILDVAKRHLLKLEKERIKQEQRAAREAAKRRKTINKKNQSVADRIKSKQQRILEEEEKGNLLFLDIKNAANAFAKRQETMNEKLESTLAEKKALAKGNVSESAQNDAIKRRVSAQVVAGQSAVGGLDMNEINRLRAMNPPIQEAAAAPQNANDEMMMMMHQMNEDEMNQDFDLKMNNDRDNNSNQNQNQNQNIDLNNAQWDDDDF